jgi:tetratricopeptide (TPR) repeat protein
MSNTFLSGTDTKTTEASRKSVTRRRKDHRIWMIGIVVCVLILLGAFIAYILLDQVPPLALPSVPAHLSASQIGLADWQEYQQLLPAHPLNDSSLPAASQVSSRLALLSDAAGQAFIQQGKLTQGLAYLKAAVLAEPANLRYGNDYRLALRDHQLYQNELDFFSGLAKKVQTPNVNIEYALSYVDLMRSCPKPPDGLVCQAQDSYSSISVLNAVLQKNPYNIIALYARGLNHLYWPSLMGHLPKAQQDLQYAVALTRFQKTIGPLFVPQAYVALGDVFAKANNIKEARNVWLNGLRAVTPSDQALLEQRLAIPQDQLNALENQQLRGLGVYVNTDLSLFWRKG